MGAGYKHWIPVYPTALIFRQDRCPREVPERDGVTLGWLGFHTRFRTVRMWTDPAERILAMNRPALLPLIPFMDATPSELIEAGRRLLKDGDEGLFTWYCIYVQTVYNEDVAEEILGRFVKMVPIELVLESEYGKKLTARATEIGEERGLDRGMERGIRRAIEDFLAARFPEVDPRGVERIAGMAQLERVLRALYAAGSAGEARGVLDNAPHGLN